MPFFFILSGYTTRYSVSIQQWCSNTKRLLTKTIKPLLLVWGVAAAYAIIFKYDQYDDFGQYAACHILKLLLSSSQEYHIFGLTINHISPIWFVVALFFARCIYDLLQLFAKRYLRVIFVTLLSFAGIAIGHWKALPYSLDIVLAIMPFMYVGDLLKNFKRFNVTTLLAGGIVWIALFLGIQYVSGTYLELVARRYPIFPLCYVAAIAATICFISASRLIERMRCCVGRQLAFMGKFTLVILVIHIFDRYIRFTYQYGGQYTQSLLRVAVVVVLFYCYMGVRRWLGSYSTFNWKT